MKSIDLDKAIHYVGMEIGIRTLALKNHICGVEELAIMSTAQVCGKISDEYEMVFASDEKIGLVRLEDLERYRDIVEIISR